MIKPNSLSMNFGIHLINSYPRASEPRLFILTSRGSSFDIMYTAFNLGVFLHALYEYPLNCKRHCVLHGQSIIGALQLIAAKHAYSGILFSNRGELLGMHHVERC